MEEWKDVKGYEGLYKISSLGSVVRLYKSHSMERKTHLGKDGYKQLCLSKNNKTTTKKIHKLIAEAFLGHIPCGFKEVVDHVNNIKIDNRLDNLQLITNRENSSKDKHGGSSVYTGVSWNHRHNKWQTQIYIYGRCVNIGSFNSERGAANQYCKAKIHMNLYDNNAIEFRDLLLTL